MPRPTTLDICKKYLFEDAEAVPVFHRDKILRLRSAFTYWYEYPRKNEPEIRDYITKQFKVSVVQAYQDIQIIKILLGNIQRTSKEWLRYQVNSMLDEAYRVAQIRKDSKAMTAAAAAKAKFNMLHLPDAEPLPYDEIVPQPFEPTDDPTPLGLKKDPDIREKKRKMLEKYIQDIEIIDVPYEEMVKDGNDGEEEDIL